MVLDIAVVYFVQPNEDFFEEFLQKPILSLQQLRLSSNGVNDQSLSFLLNIGELMIIFE